MYTKQDTGLLTPSITATEVEHNIVLGKVG